MGRWNGRWPAPPPPMEADEPDLAGERSLRRMAGHRDPSRPITLHHPSTSLNAVHLDAAALSARHHGLAIPAWWPGRFRSSAGAIPGGGLTVKAQDSPGFYGSWLGVARTSEIFGRIFRRR
jgi:hypothetical protein